MPERIVKLVVFRPTCGEGGRPILCITRVEVPQEALPEKNKTNAPQKSTYEILRAISDTNSARC